MNRVKELRIRSGMQQKELALLVGVANPTVSDWEHGKKNPSGERLRKLSQIFGVDPGVILGFTPTEKRSSMNLRFFDDQSGQNNSPVDGAVPINRSAVPIVGNIACGERITPDTNPDGYADLPEGVHADFALRCNGESMKPTFLDGDLVLIRQQPEVENGQIAAVSIDGETTLKHVYMQEGGLSLIAENPLFPPINVPADSDREIIIHGLAVGYTRIFD